MPGGELIKMRENIDILKSMDDSLDSFLSITKDSILLSSDSDKR
jgi:hypothetical protein